MEVDGIKFIFKKVVSAFRFDEDDSNQPNFHGLSHCMKAVDVIIELQDKYFFVEVKKFYNLKTSTNTKVDVADVDKLVNNLICKCRDSWLYRWAQKKIDKPIDYLCIVECLDPPLLVSLKDKLHKKMPIGSYPASWKRQFVRSVQVLNVELWNKNYPEIQIEKI